MIHIAVIVCITSVITAIILLVLSRKGLSGKLFLHSSSEYDMLRYTGQVFREAFFVVSSDWKKVFYMSPAYESIYGKKIDELYQNPAAWFNSIHPDDRDMIKTKNFEFVNNNIFENFPDYRIYRPDGSVRWVGTRLFPVKDKKGRLIRITGIAEDITERKNAEMDNIRTQELYKGIIDNTQDVIYRTDIHGNLIMVSPSVYKVLGRREGKDYIGMNIQNELYYNPEDRDRFIKLLREKGEVSDYETYLRKSDDSPIVVSTSSHLYYDSSGNVAGVEGVVRDIAERKRMEDMFNKAFHENPCPMSISDIITGFYIEVNSAWLTAMEFERSEVIGRTALELEIYKHIEDRSKIVEAIRTTGRAYNFPIDFISKNGNERNAIFFGEVIDVGGKKMLLSSVLNVTEQRKVENELRASEERFRRLAENAPDVIYRMKLPEGIYEYLSPSSVKVLGYTPEEIYTTPKIIAEIIHPAWRDYFMYEWEKLMTGEVSPIYEYKIILPDGSDKWLHQSNVLIKDDDGNSIAIEGIVSDITDRRNIEDELILKNAILTAELEVSLDGVLIVDSEGKILTSNKRFIDIWRIPEELVAEGDDKKVLNYVVSLMENPGEFSSKVSYLYEHIEEKSNDEIRFKDGRIIERYSAPVKTEAGNYLGRVWYFRDISERKNAEEGLRKSEEKFRRLAESAPIGIFLTGPDGAVIYTNPAWQKLTGLSLNESLGYGWMRGIHPEDLENIKKGWSEAVAAKTTASASFRFIQPAGTIRISYTVAAPVFDDKGEIVCFVGTNDDITERVISEEKLKTLNEEITAANEELIASNEELIATNSELETTQRKLAESEKEYRSLVDNIDIGIIVYDKDGRILLTNSIAEKIVDSFKDDMIGKSSLDSELFLWNEDSSLLLPENTPEQLVLTTGSPVKNMVIGVSNNTSKISRWILCDAYPETDQSGSIQKVISTFIDITARKRAEEEMQRLKNYMNNILDSIPDMLIGIDPDMNITLINRKTEKASGITTDEAIGKPLQNVLLDFAEIIKSMKSGIKDRQVFSVPDYLLEKDGEKRYYDLVMFPLLASGAEGAVVRIEDVTDIRRMDEQLRQAQKMETVGTLAGGLAHDFNNVLSGIVGTISLIKHYLTKENLFNEKLTGYIDILERSGNRAAEMVQQLLTLSRRYEVRMRSLDLNDSVRNVMQICRNTFDKSIDIVDSYSEVKATINGDPSQVEQVILNLCVNASHAMTIMRHPGEKPGGVMSVTVRHIRADRYFCSVHPEAEPGWYWMISHSDTGVGMDEETLRNIFDPFFTTKEREHGTGLGLSMVYSIVHHHKGFIDVYSERGVGSSFNVYFPESSDAGKMEAGALDNTVEKGSGLILVIDDEEIVRLMAESILAECGYAVILAENGREGIEKFTQESEEIKAVLLDMAMPGMSGKEVYTELKKIEPSVKVLLASGFRQDYRVDEVFKLGVNGFIQKPYSLVELSRKIKEIIA